MSGPLSRQNRPAGETVDVSVGGAVSRFQHGRGVAFFLAHDNAPDRHSMVEQMNPRSEPGRRSPTTSIMLAALLALAVGIGLWQDRSRDQLASGSGSGIVEQVVPASEELASLPTAPEAGALAPNFRLETASGETVELAELRGTPVFINFWASWCFFCLTEMPAIQKVSDEYGDQVVMLGINISDTPEDIHTYAGNNGIRYPLPMDTERTVMEAYGVRQMPTSIFVDANGVVSSVVYGVIVPDEMRANIDVMLDPAAG